MGFENIPNIDKDRESLRSLSYEQIDTLCEDIRHLLIETLSRNGGHLAPNLGVVELTIAMHRVFDSPVDQFVFDVGHQCYTHKLLTGRADRFDTIRTEGGLAGFPKPSESVHDPIVTGHSSTSISVACGLARAKRLKGEEGTVVAVIGDGALTGGLAYEGLNNAGQARDNIIVILNDNRMSISKNVGAMARHLAVIRSKKSYVKAKSLTSKIVGGIPLVGKPMRRAMFRSKSALKNAVYKNTLFDALGFAYLGPVDGHNVKQLEQVLSLAKSIKRPALVHVCTSKGKGYSYAERNPGKFHGIGKFDIDTGEPISGGASYSSVFGKALCDLAADDESVCAVTAAMKTGTGLSDFAANYHRRFHDCGIAEEHAVSYCAGLAAGGMKPVFAVYASFIQRCYDQIIHDVAIQGLNVTFAIDRAGVVGEDGETHHGLFDVAMLNTVPGMSIYSPCYFDELTGALEMCVNEPSPAAIRYPRGSEPVKPDSFTSSVESWCIYGDSDSDTIIVTYGRIFGAAAKVCDRLRSEGKKACVVKLLRIKPIDKETVSFVSKGRNVFFFEEGIRQGGIGETFISLLEEYGFNGSYTLRAVDNTFVTHA
ncbi:MAG: 1-deoxy-D-xylulose-5-phosphate synthase, partial [Ruminococcaceae bacterium]|nr:1-deoxy-D-xylulose-5-phosphate synthase [Oscillospiraceae bacterium]